jgi:hypothetical protein
MTEGVWLPTTSGLRGGVSRRNSRGVESLELPLVSPARGPPTDWGELAQAHDDRDVFQASRDELPVIDIRTL